MKIDIREWLFWIFSVLAIGILIWIIFGDSPTEVLGIITILMMVILKIWNISDRQLNLDMKFNVSQENIKNSFNNMKKDIQLIKNDNKLIKDNLTLIKNKLKV
tara:strand:+ start:257 stop:565 length:309 start_codon:yes stop_codon:yes gene_type:complete